MLTQAGEGDMPQFFLPPHSKYWNCGREQVKFGRATEMQDGGQFYNISHVFYSSVGHSAFPKTEGFLKGHTEP